MSERLKSIWAGTPQWLKHHRGTKKLEGEAFQLSAMDCRAHAIDALIDEITVRQMVKAARDRQDAEERRRRSKTQARAEKTFETARDAVLGGHEPYVNGSDVLGTIIVEDPHDRRRRIKVTNLRDDPIGQMHRRGQLLTDDEKKKRVPPSVADVRLEVARRWQGLYERAEVGGVRAIDPSKPYVTGGNFVEPDADSSGEARDQLAALRDRLGMINLTESQRITGERLFVWVLGERKTLGQVAGMLGFDRRRICLGRELIEKLDIAAVFLRVSMRPSRGPERPRDKHDDAADRYLRSFQTFSGS